MTSISNYRLLFVRFLNLLALAIAAGSVSSADDWPQWLGPNRDSVWQEDNVIRSIPESGLKEVWRTPIEAGFSGPAVAGDRVYVTDFVTQSGQHSFNPGRRSDVKGQERILCLDRKTGKVIWKKEYDSHYKISYSLGPRATPTVDGDKVYFLGAEGNLACLSTADGKEIWQRDLKQDFGATTPIWGFAAHPLIDGDKLFCIVGGQGSVAVAFNKNTGEEIWKALTASEQGYCPPAMIQAGGKKQLLIFHPEAINGMDPENGDVYWSEKLAPAYKMSIIAPLKHDDYLLTTALQSTLLLKLASDKPAVTEVWRGKGTSPDHNPPVIYQDHIYGVDVRGKLRCIELVSGERKWESLATCTNGRPANSTTGFIVRNDDHFYITTEQGELIIAKMTPASYQELGRANMVEPTAQTSGRKIVWSHPAFAHQCVFARNDKEIVCYSLAQE